MGLDTYFFRRLRKLPATAEQANIIRTTIYNADPFDPAQKEMLLGTIKDALSLLKKSKEVVTEADLATINGFEGVLDKCVADGIQPNRTDYDPETHARVREVYTPLAVVRKYLGNLYVKKAHEKKVAYFRKNWDVVEFFDHAKDEDNCKDFEMTKEDIRSLRDYAKGRLARHEWSEWWEKEDLRDVVKQMQGILNTTKFETSVVYMHNWW